MNIDKLPRAIDTINEFYEKTFPEGKDRLEYNGILFGIGTMLIDYRLEHKLTPRQLADKLGISAKMLTMLESGGKEITILQLWRLAWKLKKKLIITLCDREGERKI